MHPGYKKTRLFAPGLSAPGLATVVSRAFRLIGHSTSSAQDARKGRAERLGVVAARSLTRRAKSARHARRLSHRCTVVFTPALRTRMDFSACSISQGWPLSPASPRSCKLLPGHVLGRPPVTPASVLVRLQDKHTQKRPRSGIRSGHRIPPRVQKTI